MSMGPTRRLLIVALNAQAAKVYMREHGLRPNKDARYVVSATDFRGITPKNWMLVCLPGWTERRDVHALDEMIALYRSLEENDRWRR